MHQFAYGWINPGLAYFLSALGSLAGLTATVRARAATSTGRKARWLTLAAIAIGGTGIWTMHFVAMMGFAVDGTTIRFDLPVTLASWLTAIIVVGIGLFIVGFGRPSPAKVVLAGILTGAGVAAMHYSGMSAMRMNGTLGYDRWHTVAAVVIAVVASTVALWFTVTVYRPATLVASAAVMGLAVCGMHYVGMYGLRVHPHPGTGPVRGTDAVTFLVPIVVLVLVVVVALFYALLAMPAPAGAGPDPLDADVSDPPAPRRFEAPAGRAGRPRHTWAG